MGFAKKMNSFIEALGKLDQEDKTVQELQKLRPHLVRVGGENINNAPVDGTLIQINQLGPVDSSDAEEVWAAAADLVNRLGNPELQILFGEARSRARASRNVNKGPVDGVIVQVNRLHGGVHSGE